MSYEIAYHETEYNPAEYYTSNPFECDECRGEFDLDDDAHVETIDGIFCVNCIPRCACGECGLPVHDRSGFRANGMRLIMGEWQDFDCFLIAWCVGMDEYEGGKG